MRSGLFSLFCLVLASLCLVSQAATDTFVFSDIVSPGAFVYHEGSPYENGSSSDAFYSQTLYNSWGSGPILFAKFKRSSSLPLKFYFRDASGVVTSPNWAFVSSVSFSYRVDGAGSWTTLGATCNPTNSPSDRSCLATISTPSSGFYLEVYSTVTFTNSSAVVYPSSGSHKVLLMSNSPDVSLVWRSASTPTQTGTLDDDGRAILFDYAHTRLSGTGCTGFTNPPFGTGITSHGNFEFKDSSGSIIVQYGCRANQMQTSYLRCDFIIPYGTVSIVQNYRGCQATNPTKTDADADPYISLV